MSGTTSGRGQRGGRGGDRSGKSSHQPELDSTKNTTKGPLTPEERARLAILKQIVPHQFVKIGGGNGIGCHALMIGGTADTPAQIKMNKEFEELINREIMNNLK